MKLQFIKRGAATRLILIFSGWSTTPEFYHDLTFDGWDTATVTDYRDPKGIEVPSQYKTVYIFAYSLGVWAADISDIPATVRVAIAGTPVAVSDEYGIPEEIYRGTEYNLDKRNLMKFHRRMAGGKETYRRISELLPENPDIERLRNELAYIRENPNTTATETLTSRQRWHRAYIPEEDAIIPSANQSRWWNLQATEIVKIPGGHATDLHKTIGAIIPDHTAIGNGFRKSLPDYKGNAIAQGEAADRIAAILSEYSRNHPIKSILEIGCGPGLMTERWSAIVTPEHATFIDLYPSDKFGIAKEEEYIVGDAEEWMENTDNRFDVIVSASAIQWFADPIRFLVNLRTRLTKGGIAIVSTFLKGNLAQLDAVRPSPIIYRTYEEYSKVSDKMEAWTRNLTFGSAREALMHLKRTGVSGKSAFNTSLTKTISSLADGKLTYKPAVIIIKND